MDADVRSKCLYDFARDFAHFMRKRAAVRIAKDKTIRARILRRLERRKRVFGAILVAVKKVLRVVHDFLAMGLQEANRVTDHRAIFILGRSQHFLHMKTPALAEDGADRRVCLDQCLAARIVLGLHARATRAAECRDLCVLQLLLLDGMEELHVLGIGRGIAAFDVVHAEFIEPLGDKNLADAGKGDALPLRPIAQRRVVDFDSHRQTPKPET